MSQSKKKKKVVKRVRVFDIKKIDPDKHLVHVELELDGATPPPVDPLPAVIHLDTNEEEPRTGFSKWWCELWDS